MKLKNSIIKSVGEMFKKFFSQLFISKNSKMNTFFVNLINYMLFISLASILTINRIYPYNYISNGLLLLTLAIIIVYLYISKKIFLNTHIVLFILLVLLSFLSTILNGFSFDSLSFVYLVIIMIPIYMFYYTEKETREIFVKLIIIAYICFNLFFFAIYFKELITLDFTRRLGDIIGNENDVATILLTGHAIYMFYLLKGKYALIPFLLLNLLEMLVTVSRSGLLNILLITIYLLYILVGKHKKSLFFSILAIMLVSSILILQLPALAYIKNRFDIMIKALLGTSKSDESFLNRLNLIFDGIELFLKNVIFGAGKDAMQRYTFIGKVSHNNYIELGAMYGVFVLLIYLYLYFSVFVKPLGGEKKELFRVIVISFILFHLTLTAYYYKAPYIILPIILSYKNNELYNNISIVSSGGEV